MTKKEIAKKISEQSGITVLRALEAVQMVFDGIIETWRVRGGIKQVPALADARKGAGYENAKILVHCREPGPHGMRCGVVDLLLGKE